MDIKEIQNKVDDWIKNNTKGYWKPLSIMARVTEEVGELAREINHRYGEKKKKESENEKEIELEIADVLFVVISLANALNIDLEEAFNKTMEKYEKRDKDRWK